MEVITIESQAFRDLTAKIDMIAKFVSVLQSRAEDEPDDGWADSCEVCTFLKISSKTLQRLRASGAVSYSQIRGKNFYRISEIQRLLNDNVIRRCGEHLQNLINNYKLHALHAEQRRNIKTDILLPFRAFRLRCLPVNPKYNPKQCLSLPPPRKKQNRMPLYSSLFRRKNCLFGRSTELRLIF